MLSLLQISARIRLSLIRLRFRLSSGLTPLLQNLNSTVFVELCLRKWRKYTVKCLMQSRHPMGRGLRHSGWKWNITWLAYPMRLVTLRNWQSLFIIIGSIEFSYPLTNQAYVSLQLDDHRTTFESLRAVLCCDSNLFDSKIHEKAVNSLISIENGRFLHTLNYDAFCRNGVCSPFFIAENDYRLSLSRMVLLSSGELRKILGKSRQLKLHRISLRRKEYHYN